MVNGSAGHAAAIANAIKATGAIVRVSPEDFQEILRRARDPIVVVAESGALWFTGHRYLTSYRGLAFYTTSRDAIPIPPGAEIIAASRIWVPS